MWDRVNAVKPAVLVKPNTEFNVKNTNLWIMANHLQKFPINIKHSAKWESEMLQFSLENECFGE